MMKNTTVMSAIFFAFILYCSAECSSRISQEDFFDDYKYDEFDFRVINQSLLNIDAKKHFIIAGDSNVFGEGCKDEETLAAVLSKDLADYHIYNWGLEGGGPHDSLYLMEYKNTLKLIKEKEGVMVYNLFPFLYERVIGSKNYLKWSQRTSPYYQLNSDEILSYLGNFEDRFLITAFYKFLNKFKWIDSLIPNLPQIHSRHIKLIAHIFKKMSEVYLTNFPRGKFIVIINKYYDIEPIQVWQNKQMEGYLKELNISFKVFPTGDNSKGNYTFPDGHINPKGQKLQANFYKMILQ